MNVKIVVQEKDRKVIVFLTYLISYKKSKRVKSGDQISHLINLSSIHRLDIPVVGNLSDTALNLQVDVNLERVEIPVFTVGNCGNFYHQP